LSAAFEMEYVGAADCISVNDPMPLDTLTIRANSLFRSNGKNASDTCMGLAALVLKVLSINSRSVCSGVLSPSG